MRAMEDHGNKHKFKILYTKLMNRSKSFFGHMFHDRKIIFVSRHRHRTIHFPKWLQVSFACILLVALAWVPFSMGRVAAYNSQIIQMGNMEEGYDDLEDRLYDLEGDIGNLEKYLNYLYRSGKMSNKNFDEVFSYLDAEDYEYDKLSYLEYRKKIVESHVVENLFRSIGKIEKAFDKIGVDYSHLVKESFEKAAAGGPYIPVDLDELESFEEEGKFYSFGNEDFTENFEYLNKLNEMAFNIPLAMPIKNAYISSYYGYRRDPFHGRVSMHRGLDFAGEWYGKIYSAAPGKVVKAWRNGAYGLTIDIEHANGFMTRYAHLKKMKVKKGDAVKRGQIIGYQGNTGRSTGQHLHYEIHKDGKAINPLPFIKYARRVAAAK